MQGKGSVQRHMRSPHGCLTHKRFHKHCSLGILGGSLFDFFVCLLLQITDLCICPGSGWDRVKFCSSGEQLDVNYMLCCFIAVVTVLYFIAVSNKLFLSQPLLFSFLCLQLSFPALHRGREGARGRVRKHGGLGNFSGNTELGKTIPKP